MIGALYVDPRGAYANLADVEVWDESRDARLYAGPWPVVAHPPCSRWSVLAAMVEAVHGHKRGDDGGCFAAALAAVRAWGGVLEHPAESQAWRAFGLHRPPRGGGWVVADDRGGWTCRVDQAPYGHRLIKPTWLYACGVELPSLRWGRRGGARRNVRFMSQTERRRGLTRDEAFDQRGDRLSLGGSRGRDDTRLVSATPIEFRDVLLGMARTARRTEAA